MSFTPVKMFCDTFYYVLYIIIYVYCLPGWIYETQIRNRCISRDKRRDFSDFAKLQSDAQSPVLSLDTVSAKCLQLRAFTRSDIRAIMFTVRHWSHF